MIVNRKAPNIVKYIQVTWKECVVSSLEERDQLLKIYCNLGKECFILLLGYSRSFYGNFERTKIPSGYFIVGMFSLLVSQVCYQMAAM